ncbi:MAG TPA: Uma2 family endonuclease [Acetobacteraceae bacterium]|nr:Uma2 family endonuclease [Acetobacteraceae bacterium]
MSGARLHRWTLGEFLAWEERQEAKFELVDGQPRMMTGGTQAHHLIALNIIVGLRELLRGSPCRAWGPDIRVVTGTGNARYPDALIDCGAFQPASHDSSEPVVICEVLSRSTAWLDLQGKLRDYDATATIRQYIVIAQDEPNIVIWTRSADGRLTLGASLTGLDDSVAFEPVGARLPLAAIYDGISFAAE